MNKEEKDKKERERDPFGKKVFFSIGIDSEGCLSIYTPEQKRGKEPRVSFSPEFVKLLLLACEFEFWPDEILMGIREGWEKIEQQDREFLEEEARKEAEEEELDADFLIKYLKEELIPFLEKEKKGDNA